MNDTPTDTDAPLDSLVERLAELAQRRGLTIAVAESLTSGIVVSTLGKGSEATEWLRGGIVAYSTEVKQSVLGVAPGPVVCAPCAEQMAEGVARLLGADAAISTTGVGGPGSVEGQEPGTVFLGWWHEGRRGHAEHHFVGDPERVLRLTADASIRLLIDLAEGRTPATGRARP